ncbi:MAG: hypothetical protein P8L85_07260 [Rubripirellula sp.]|nr:hypothetical protein [Rubripirellula sp.]
MPSPPWAITAQGNANAVISIQQQTIVEWSETGIPACGFRRCANLHGPNMQVRSSSAGQAIAIGGIAANVRLH